MVFGNIVEGEYQELDLAGWKEVADKPAFDCTYQKLTGPVLSQDETQYVYSVENLPIEQLAQSAYLLVAAARRSTLDTIVNGAGVGQAYARNIQAADFVLGGNGSTLMWAGMTAEAYAAGMGSKVSMSAAQWATWVTELNTTESLRGALVEQQYLEFTMAIGNCASHALMVQYPEMYSEVAAELLAASDPSTVGLAEVPVG